MYHQPFNQKVYNYLHYGYLPPEKIPTFLTNLDTYEPIKPTVENTVALFDEVFTEAIEKSVGNGYCIIPVSGGWDSRILLGYALEALPSKQIKTYTFGSKGQLDFDIGKHLAKKAGVEHEAFDLNLTPVSWDDLKEAAEKAPWTYIFDSFFNKYCYKQMSSGADMLLSGFMGDPLTGGHIYQQNGDYLKQYFANKQAIIKFDWPEKSLFDPVESLPSLPRNTSFSDHQLLDLGVRQSSCIAPIVSNQRWTSWDTSLGTIADSKTEIIAPFAHPKWIWYWLHVPCPLKRDRILYLNFLKSKFPNLAKLPSKDFYGAKRSNNLSYIIRRKKYYAKNLLNKKYPSKLSAPKELLNYLDYDMAFRDREDYKVTLDKALVALKELSLVNWLDFDKLKKEHLEYKHQHSKLFLLLIGLALNVDVMKK